MMVTAPKPVLALKFCTRAETEDAAELAVVAHAKRVRRTRVFAVRAESVVAGEVLGVADDLVVDIGRRVLLIRDDRRSGRLGVPVLLEMLR